MGSDSEKFKNFNTLLMQGIGVLSKLSAALEEERTALSERSMDDMQSSIDKKKSLIDEFLQSNKARSDILIAEKLEVNAEGTRTFIAQAPTPVQPILTKNWEALQDHLKSLQEQNLVNGQVASRNLRNVDQLLTIMSGQKDSNRLYNQKGSAGAYQAQSRIGKA